MISRNQTNKLPTGQILLFLSYFILFTAPFLYGEKPVINISTTAISPRLGMLDPGEAVNWRSLVQYNQTIGSRITISSLFEYGSGNERFINPFRIHSFALTFRHRDAAMSIGRLTLWNTARNLRVDGVQFLYRSGKYGEVKLLSGYKAVTDFQYTALQDDQIMLISWAGGKLGKNLSLTLWSENINNVNEPYASYGFTMRVKGIALNNTLVWDLNDSRVQYARLRVRKKIGKHSLAIGYRQRRFIGYDTYTWVTRSYNIAPTATIDLFSTITNKVVWWNQGAYRFGEEPTKYIRSTLMVGGIQVGLYASRYGDTSLYGGLVGFTKTLSKPFAIGASLSVNAVDYGDLIAPQKSNGFYGWVNWKVRDKIAVRFFTRYYVNPFYKVDGRGGLTVNVAI